MVKKRKLRRTSEPRKISEDLYALLGRMGGTSVKAKLSGLWANWTEIMGADISSWTITVHAQGDCLILEAEHSVQMQSLQFIASEIVEKANEFLGEEYFRSFRIELALSVERHRSFLQKVAEATPPPELVMTATGRFLAEMDSSSSVYRCYARFSRRAVK